MLLGCIPLSGMIARTPLSRPTASGRRRGAPTNGSEKRHASPSPFRNHGGRGAPLNAARPKEVDPQISSRFHAVDTDKSGYISATELQSALREEGWPSFEIDTVKLLMSMFDTDRNGTIDIDEFNGLWEYIKNWESVFRRFDTNHNDTIDGDELRQALQQLGYELSPALQDLLQRKYDVNWNFGESAAGGGPAAAPRAGRSSSSGITFDRFMRACVVVKQVKESFDALDRDPYGRVNVDYDTFLKLVFKLP